MRKEELAGKLNERKFRDKLKREGGRGGKEEKGMLDAREWKKRKKIEKKKKGRPASIINYTNN